MYRMVTADAGEIGQRVSIKAGRCCAYPIISRRQLLNISLPTAKCGDMSLSIYIDAVEDGLVGVRRPLRPASRLSKNYLVSLNLPRASNSANLRWKSAPMAR